MIATFKVRNFRSFKGPQILSFEPSKEQRESEHCCVDIKDGTKLLKTALIYGSNASGKTNILLALETLRDLIKTAPQDKTKTIPVEPFLLDHSSKNEPTIFEITFYIEGEKYVYELNIDKDRVYTEDLYFYPKSQPAKLYFRNYDPNTDATEIMFGPQLELSDTDRTIILGNTLNNCTVMAAFGKSNVATSRINKIFSFFATQVKDILYPSHDLSQYTLTAIKEHPEIKNFLIEELQNSDFNICDIEVESNEVPMPQELQRAIENDSNIPEEAKKEILKRPYLTDEKLLYAHCTEEGVHILPQNLESRGTLRFSGLAVLLYDLKYNSSIRMIDEAETSLHYDMLSHFIKEFLYSGKQHSQLIITTHDINLLDEDFIRRDTIWFAEKNERGESSLSRLSDQGLHTNVSVYKAYKKHRAYLRGDADDSPFKKN